jgi:hypothetical protein
MRALVPSLFGRAGLLFSLVVGAGFGAPLRAQTLEDVVWAAVALERVLQERDYPGILALGALDRLSGGMEREGLASGPASEVYREAALWLSGAVRTVQGVGGCRALSDPQEGVLCSLERLLPSAPPTVARVLSAEGRALLSTSLRAQAGAAVQDPFQRHVEQVLERSAGLRARVNALDGAVSSFDPVVFVGQVIGVDLTLDSQTLLARARGLQGIVRTHPSVLSFEGTLAEGRSVLDEYERYLANLSGSARGLLDGARGIEGQIRDAGDRASHRAMVYLTRQAATLAGVEAGVTERIRVLGNAAVDFQAEGSLFLRNARELGQQAALGILSGNMLTVAAGVASFLQLTPGAFGPDAARELREVREILGAVEGELRAGFEGVDARFDTLFEEMDRGFGQMEALVTRNHREVVAELGVIQSSLSDLEERTERFEANVTAYLQAGFDRDHARTLIRCLEHRERFLTPIAPQVFGECLTDFRARGSRDARDALLTDRTTPVDDRALIGALSDRSLKNLSRSLPLLARAAEQRFSYPALGGGRGGANPVEWTVSAEAYLAMLRDWPDLAAQVGPADLEALLAVGVELQEILRALVVDPASGSVGRFADQLLDAYGAGLREVVEESDRLARRHQQAELRRVDPQSLLTRARPEGGMSAGLGDIELPRHVAQAIPTEIRTATVLALESPTVVYRLTLADSVSLENERRRWTFFGRDHDRLTFARTTLEIELRQGGGTVVQSWRVTGPPVLRQVEVMAGREGGDQVRSTRVEIADPAAHFLQTFYPTLAASSAGWSTREPPRALLNALGSSIEDELRRFESVSLNRVFGATCEVGATGTPLDADDLNSSARLRRALESMTAARVMLGALVGLALPPERQRAEPMASLLDGPDGLLDRDRLCQIVAAGESPLRVVWLEAEPMERMEALGASLQGALEGVTESPATPGARPVPRTLVDDAVDGLRWSIRVQRLPRPGAP